MIVKRDIYLQRLIDRMHNGAIKVITSLRRSDKSTLLFKIFYDYLLSLGVEEKNIITIDLDSDTYEELHDYKKLGNHTIKLLLKYKKVSIRVITFSLKIPFFFIFYTQYFYTSSFDEKDNFECTSLLFLI